MIVESKERPVYLLDELLEQCEPSKEISEEEQEWINALPAGDEIL